MHPKHAWGNVGEPTGCAWAHVPAWAQSLSKHWSTKSWHWILFTKQLLQRMAGYQQDLSTPAGGVSLPVSSKGSPAKRKCCITSKDMEARAEYRESLIHCMGNLLHHFCPYRYRLWDNLCYLEGQRHILLPFFCSARSCYVKVAVYGFRGITYCWREHRYSFRAYNVLFS